MSSLPITTTLPGFPRPFPAQRGPATSELLRAPWRWLRSRRQDPSRLTARLRKAASKGRPIVLGTSARPWSPAADNSPASAAASPLASLRSFRGLEIRVTTRSPRILQTLAVLIDLDRDNAVSVDVAVRDLNLRSRPAREALELVRRLAAEGLQVRVLVPARHLAEAAGDRLRRLFEAARRAGAFDVRAAAKRDDAPWRRRFERLRLQHGFPQLRPGRG